MHPHPLLPGFLRYRLFSLLTLAPLLGGCGPTVSSHTIDVVVDYDGVVTHGVLDVPDHDEEIEGMDDSCGIYTGNCGTFTTARATVTGAAPVLGAMLTTAGDGSSRTYDLTIRRNDDEGTNERPDRGPITCRVYHFTDRRDLSGFGTPEKCYNTTRNVTVTLTFRDGDEG